ncbi:MAG: hypothetical protein C0418_05495 [Coriobacteriaceae bacterium]|nr:hypothetical protein [Coriobacteriaceae bacterium]
MRSCRRSAWATSRRLQGEDFGARRYESFKIDIAEGRDLEPGTCSWTEKTMVERWYPPGTSSPEAKLRYYAERFDTVEVDSTCYGMPQRAYAMFNNCKYDYAPRNAADLALILSDIVEARPGGALPGSASDAGHPPGPGEGQMELGV